MAELANTEIQFAGMNTDFILITIVSAINVSAIVATLSMTVTNA